MLKLIIEDDEGRKTVVPFVRDEITIGRQEGNTIRLTERNVSRRHARLLRSNGSVVVEDLGSYNGIRVNGEKVTGRANVSDGDLIQIGDYDLAIQHEDSPSPPAHTPA
ncbi:MAG: FHA domain-containing protein, partial [Myxococcaceae bacterium]|nr:FHA domain-containing protein [Myxococcaceae bacterium]